mmetsp:Transcript_22021/g.68090  ORF Transcript_22021/g.68090 Transcript_22021/m.68090 type:complete len:304 (+) Transcript_22021:663-1574(+)
MQYCQLQLSGSPRVAAGSLHRLHEPPQKRNPKILAAVARPAQQQRAAVSHAAELSQRNQRLNAHVVVFGHRRAAERGQNPAQQADAQRRRPHGKVCDAVVAHHAACGERRQQRQSADLRRLARLPVGGSKNELPCLALKHPPHRPIAEHSDRLERAEGTHQLQLVPRVAQDVQDGIPTRIKNCKRLLAIACLLHIFIAIVDIARGLHQRVVRVVEHVENFAQTCHGELVRRGSRAAHCRGQRLGVMLLGDQLRHLLVPDALLHKTQRDILVIEHSRPLLLRVASVRVEELNSLLLERPLILVA